MTNLENAQEKEPEFFIDYQKWRRLVYHSNKLCMLVVLVTEIAMFFVFRAHNLFLQPIPVYLFRFLILPTLISLTLLLLGAGARKIFKEKERLLNAIPILQLTLLCFMASTVHHVFAVTFCTFSFPIFLSSIFSDTWLTRGTTALGIVLMTVAQFIGPGYNDVYSDYIMPQYVVAVIALLTSFLVCTVLGRFQTEKNGIIEVAYQSRMKAIEQLNFDQKTGLYGITAFHGRLDQLLRENPDQQAPAIVMLDIDDFKRVNDTYGHANGDEVILCLAELMKESCKERFFPVRFGGEEFIILFFDGAWQDYKKVVKHLLVEFAAMEYDFTDTTITVSAGMAAWEPGCTGDELFARADKALYRSKANGKNRISVYEKDGESLLFMKETGGIQNE